MSLLLRAASGSAISPLFFSLLVAVRQSQGFIFPCRQYCALRTALSASPPSLTRSFSRGSGGGILQSNARRSGAASIPATVEAEEQRGSSARRGGNTVVMSAAVEDEIGDVADVRERAEAMHSVMPSEGKEAVKRQATRDAHNRRQATVFNSKADFFSSPEATPPEQFPSLRRIAEACCPSGDLAGSRVVDVGCGTGALVSFLTEAGVQEGAVIGIDMSCEMGNVFGERFPEAQVITSEFVDYVDEGETIKQEKVVGAEAAEGQDGSVGGDNGGGKGSAVGTIVFNAVFGNVWDQMEALERAATLLEEEGKVVISHPLGKQFVSRLKAVDDTVVPHDLPDRDELEKLTQFLPFVIDSFESGRDLYLAVLRKTPHRASEVVRYLRGEVSPGYGRGGKKLGVPTANLPESLFAEKLRPMPTGIYFGWAAIEGATADSTKDDGAAAGDDPGTVGNEGGAGPWKCVANVGYSPTFAGQENAEKIVEGHLIGYKGGDFYGKNIRMLLMGFQRSEKKFASFPELVAAINKDVGDASAALDEPRFAAFKADSFFSGSSEPQACAMRDFQSALEAASASADS